MFSSSSSSSSDFSSIHLLFTEKKKKAKWQSIDYEFQNMPSCFEISPDETSIAVGDLEGRLTTLRLSSDEEGQLLVTDEIARHESRITDIAFNPTSDLVATCSNEPKFEITSFRSDTSTIGKRGMKISMTDRVRALTFMQDLANRSNNIIFSGVGRQICITDCCSASTFRTLKGHKGIVTAFCTWGGCMFASSSMDKTIRIWDMRVCDAVKVFDPLLKPATIGSTSFHVDGSGRVLFRGDGDGTLHAFDLGSTKKICSNHIFGHSSVLCVRIASAKRFVVASDEKCICLCDFRDLYQVPMHCTVANKSNSSAKCLAIRWYPEQSLFASLDSGKLLRLWQPEPPEQSDVEMKHADADGDTTATATATADTDTGTGTGTGTS